MPHLVTICQNHCIFLVHFSDPYQASGLYFVFLKAWQLYHQNKYRRRETRQNFKIKIQLARTSWNALAELSIKSSINSNSNWITAEILMLALFLRSSCLPDFIYSLLCLRSEDYCKIFVSVQKCIRIDHNSIPFFAFLRPPLLTFVN